MDYTDETTKKRVAVIGAGVSGLQAIVALKEEGIEPVCFETRSSHGGTWNYREESVSGYASTMATTVLNNSKEMGAVSNFPPKKEYSNYLRHRDHLQYLTDFYRHHDLQKYICFNTEVISVQKAEDYDGTGRFYVKVKDQITGKDTMDIFDGVVVAIGHLNVPKMIDFPGLKKFKGTVMHTHSLKTVEKFKGQNVLIVGCGCSGLDAAEVISSVAKQVYLSSRSGMYVLPRVGLSGYPSDYVLTRRYLLYFLDKLPIDFCSWYLETFYLDPKFDNNFYYVKPQYHYLCKDPALNDGIHSKLLSGSVVQKGGVKHFTENGVVFDEEEDITDIDSVVMATGYKWSFPFLEEGLLQNENGRLNLYKCMYPTQLPHSTLVFVGFINPNGSVVMISEVQSRFASQVFSKKVKLPPNEKMLKEAVERYAKNEKRFAPSEYLSTQIDVGSYCDSLASEIGVKPNLLKYLFTDFPLFLRLLFGPFLSYQYRLEGPHKWDGAREAIMTCSERMHWPLSREKGSKKGFMQKVFEFIGNLIPRNIFVY